MPSVNVRDVVAAPYKCLDARPCSISMNVTSCMVLLMIHQWHYCTDMQLPGRDNDWLYEGANPPFRPAAQVKWRKGEEGAEAAEEERVVSVIASLLSSITRGSRRERVCAKFVEAEFEKCDRLVELYTRYDARVRAEEVRTGTG